MATHLDIVKKLMAAGGNFKERRQALRDASETEYVGDIYAVLTEDYVYGSDSDNDIFYTDVVPTLPKKEYDVVVWINSTNNILHEPLFDYMLGWMGEMEETNTIRLPEIYIILYERRWSELIFQFPDESSKLAFQMMWAGHPGANLIAN